MKKNIKTIGVFVLCLLIVPALIYADVNDYLILEDIGSYKLFTGIPGRIFSGPPSKYSQTATGGILDAAGHFSENDQSYEASYTAPGSKWPFVKVEVTQHAGSDSDKWLLHEVDMYFRNYYGIPGRSYIVRKIDGNTIIAYGAGGWAYRWLRDNKVIHIAYTDLQMTKPEPLEVVKAYLAKHPSTLPSTITATVQKSLEGKTTWIKDEMDRRLWLGDKWIARIETVGDLNELSSVVKSLNVFLTYREKYYGIEAATEKQTLSEYLLAKNQAGIKTKLEEYKTWWAANKDNPISL